MKGICSLMVFLFLTSVSCCAQGQLNDYDTLYSGIIRGFDVVGFPSGSQFHIGVFGNVPALMKTDSLGKRIWSEKMMSSGNDMLYEKVIKCTPSSMLILGFLHNSIYDYETTIIKADTFGNIVWAKTYTNNNRNPYRDIINTHDGQFLLLMADTIAYNLVKIDTSGNVIWSKTLSTPGNGELLGEVKIYENADSSIVISTSHYGSMPFTNANSTQILFAKLDANGNNLWAKQIVPYYNLTSPYWIYTPIYNGGHDIIHTSNDEYVIVYGVGAWMGQWFWVQPRYTKRLTSNGNVITGKDIVLNTDIKLLSEQPTGRINIAAMGGQISETGQYEFPKLIRTTTNLDSLSTFKYAYSFIPPIMMQYPVLYFNDAHQLSNHQYVFTGNNEWWSVLIADSSGQQSCTSSPGTSSFISDTSLHDFPISLTLGTGINVFPQTITASFYTISYCNCDSLPKANFGFSLIGNTFQFIDSSTNGKIYHWDFGDNSYDTTHNPTHTYATLTNRVISLKVSNRCGTDIRYFNYLPFNVTTTSTPTTCSSMCNGSIVATAFNGVPPYMYQLNNGTPQTSNVFNNVCSGNNFLHVTDNLGNVVLKTVNVNTGYYFNLSFTSSLACIGLSNGSLTVSTQGGYPPFNYSWSNNTTLNSSINPNIPAGSYTVTVTDSNQCVDTQTHVLNNLIIPITVGFMNDCVAECTAYYGQAPYTYTCNGMQSIGQYGAFYGLTPGANYTISVIDANGCIGQNNNFQMPDTQIVHINLVAVSNVNCNGNNNGVISVNVTGGNPMYHYTWSNGFIDSTTSASNLSTNNNLAAGVYIVLAVDHFGCWDKDTINLTQPSSLTAYISGDTLICGGNNIGHLLANASGGNPPYSYAWSTTPVQTSPIINGLSGGLYSVTISDANNCTYSASQVIVQPNSISISFLTQDDNGSCNGIINATVSGGLPPYQYLWSNNNNTLTINNLCSGWYSITLTDSMNCQKTDSVFVPFLNDVNNINSKSIIKVFPNPAKDLINIQYSKVGNIVLSDLTGRILGQWHLADNKEMETIPVSQFAKGVYILHFTTHEEQYVYKIIID